MRKLTNLTSLSVNSNTIPEKKNELTYLTKLQNFNSHSSFLGFKEPLNPINGNNEEIVAEIESSESESSIRSDSKELEI